MHKYKIAIELLNEPNLLTDKSAVDLKNAIRTIEAFKNGNVHIYDLDTGRELGRERRYRVNVTQEVKYEVYVTAFDDDEAMKTAEDHVENTAHKFPRDPNIDADVLDGTITDTDVEEVHQ